MLPYEPSRCLPHLKFMITDWKSYHRAYYKKRRAAIINYLGGKCAVCGCTDNLEVDHINRADKSFNISKRCSLRTIKSELTKCQLLCTHHHLEKTALEQTGFRHGTHYAWLKKKCRCVVCKPVWRAWHDARNLQRRNREVS